MTYKIFYCWQSDLPSSTNLGFIEKALESVAKAIRKDDSVQVEPDIDRDTRGVPGAPDITSTIFAKIEQSQAFVCDVSIINGDAIFSPQQPDIPRLPRPTPNPNVLIELGYALKVLGSMRIVLVFNTAFGKLEHLPFDLHTKRVVTYHMPEKLEAGSDRATERRELERKLEIVLRDVVGRIDAQQLNENERMPSIGEQTRTAIQNMQPNQGYMLTKFMGWLLSELNALAPDFSREGEFDDLLIDALRRTEDVFVEFAQVAEVIAATEAAKTAHTLYKSFTSLVEHYNPAPGFSGSYRRIDFDFYEFIGHELFVIFFSFLIREELWELIADLLENGIYVKNPPQQKAEIVAFKYLSEYIELLAHRNKRLQLNRISLHADILNERHTNGMLGQLVPMRQFMDADYFLFLRSQLERDSDSGGLEWRPWSTLYMATNPPLFLMQANRTKYASRLLRPLGVENLEMLRKRLAERGPKLGKMFGMWADVDPLERIDLQKIGTQ